MSSIKKGQLTADTDWRKHLRPFGKEMFWSGEREAAKADVAKRLDEVEEDRHPKDFRHEDRFYMWKRSDDAEAGREQAYFSDFAPLACHCAVETFAMPPDDRTVVHCIRLERPIPAGGAGAEATASPRCAGHSCPR